MSTFPDMLSSCTCNNCEFRLNCIVNYDGLIPTVCYKNANLYFSLQVKTKLKFIFAPFSVRYAQSPAVSAQ
jgi:hypothetical protein